MEVVNLMEMTKRYILFGAGMFGKQALEYLGKEQVAFFADNNEALWGTEIQGIKVISFARLKEIHKDYEIVISVDARKAAVLAGQLEQEKIGDYHLFIDMLQKVATASAKDELEYAAIFQRAEHWLLGHTVFGKGIINNTEYPNPYPEVTGYYIPTLLRWGYRDLALSYASWLCSIQKKDGSWYDTADKAPYVFDTAQILKGLLEIRKLNPDVDEAVKKGCGWILSCMDQNGRLVTPDKSQWGEDGECSELIHLYCLEPLYTAASVYGEEAYKQGADRIKRYYIDSYRDKILGFGFLSHFYAYVLEALYDIGEIELLKEAMKGIEALQREDGMVPAYKNVNWVCSTGLFQLALVWYKLGNLERGNKAFRYACSLQNETGGWYGSYASISNPDIKNEAEYPRYFARSEISWAVKYFLDALSFKCRLEFEQQSSHFLDGIEKEDGRYQLVLNEIRRTSAKKVCDVGCGKGRYLHNLQEDTKGICYYAVDVSARVMEAIKGPVEKKQGSLTQIPYADESFDVVYTAEALEHAICTENALKELLRVTKSGGSVIVIDKNESARGLLTLEEWEQWFDDEFFMEFSRKNHCSLEIERNLPYEGGVQDGLFSGWILRKNQE